MSNGITSTWEFDGELIRGLYEVINLEGDQEMEKIIMGELLFYKMGAGMFGTPVVVSMWKEIAPGKKQTYVAFWIFIL